MRCSKMGRSITSSAERKTRLSHGSVRKWLQRTMPLITATAEFMRPSVRFLQALHQRWQAEFLALCPVRLDNLAQMRIGEHLRFVGCAGAGSVHSTRDEERPCP